TKPWGRVSADKDQVYAACSKQAGANPSGPPISNTTFWPSCIHVCKCSATFSVVQDSPCSSQAMTLLLLGIAANRRLHSSCCHWIEFPLLPRLAVATSTRCKEHC